MTEPDFTTTISRLKEYVKEAETAVENMALKKFVFQFLQPLRNTGFSQGVGQVEEGCNSLVGEIDLIRERQLKAESENCQKQTKNDNNLKLSSKKLAEIIKDNSFVATGAKKDIHFGDKRNRWLYRQGASETTARIAWALADFFCSEDPSFDRDKFEESCGIEY